ncbi:MAG: tetratricopeptide repeat protein, partial [Polyangiaceae bacterium]|nr:tetratricopeptide repeat protein [Polyangiaceae bacterium]
MPGSPPESEEFLYHLYRGSDMLMQNRVGEAKDALEQALALQPQDAKGQDLLAGVYFRLGVYPRAIEIWERLVAAYPKDATLRVNLALALFKTGQADEALSHVHAALRIQPDHERAWGYLGLINWRSGRFEAARDAFLRGGQATMARRMEDVLARPRADEIGEDAATREREEREMRSAAEEALAQLEDGKPLPMAVDGGSSSERPAGGWRTIE